MCRAEKQHIDIRTMTHINKNLNFMIVMLYVYRCLLALIQYALEMQH